MTATATATNLLHVNRTSCHKSGTIYLLLLKSLCRHVKKYANTPDSSKHKISDLHCIKGDEKPYLIALVENLNHQYEISSLRCCGILCGNLRSPGRGGTWTHPCCQIRTTSDHPETWKPFGTGFVTHCRFSVKRTDSIAGKTH
ncbi:hypothetical protein CDAR_244192 [Caerostris darwini]|uniref:Uncharacterized protein n=1 Tax=Caerostris darwini TaxID=1538125 RepID=A0AAV4RGJ9_9ARAC|nr:hypothetical protein CDAR_244192 [Caerostris darwini]